MSFTNTTTNSYTFTAVNLPPGLSINGSTGVISGTPTTSGFYPVTVTAAGAGNPSTSFGWNVSQASSQFTLKAPVPTITLAPNSGGYVAVNISPASGFTSTVSFMESGTPSSVSAALTTTITATKSISDWCQPQNYPGETTATGMTYRVTPSGATGNGSCNVYAYSIPIPSGKIVQSLTPPATRNIVVLAVTMAPLAMSPVSLSSAFNVWGIFNHGVAATNGGFDGSSYAYSGSLLGTSLTATSPWVLPERRCGSQ